ncbi:hypothetical protein OsI_16803 [Oryza sativa Indica Group]|uniref:Uncharacterized protein n=1 Tax=Oryza sativa subsp. indica TaxID=39946 RepID=B8ASK7_ORYSI|nr:hypothetical protein OsI_16803 [Oryza sativa Indica Group]
MHSKKVGHSKIPFSNSLPSAPNLLLSNSLRWQLAARLLATAVVGAERWWQAEHTHRRLAARLVLVAAMLRTEQRELRRPRSAADSPRRPHSALTPLRAHYASSPTARSDDAPRRCSPTALPPRRATSAPPRELRLTAPALPHPGPPRDCASSAPVFGGERRRIFA